MVISFMRGIYLALPVLISALLLFGCTLQQNKSSLQQVQGIVAREQPQNENAFSNFGLKTDTSKSEINLNEVLSGGPGKDGIPALTSPKFVPVSQKPASVKQETEGIAVGKKFYPFNILVWHEIVNDEVNGLPLAVTFCPLCGSAIVFDRRIEGRTLEFGVSGLLYHSNLLMYDRQTESLWSQVQGRAVVGEFMGTGLNIVKANVMNFSQFSQKYPSGLVLSDQTGHIRDYSFYPYGDYETNDQFYFPVGDYSGDLPAKEIVFALPVGGTVAVFPLNELQQTINAEISVEGRNASVKYSEGDVTANVDGKESYGYYAMYFSVATQNKNVTIWKPDA